MQHSKPGLIQQANREWMKITEDTEPFPGVPPHYWGLMSDGDELPDFSANYADAFFGVNAGPASGGGGRATAPAAATAPGAAATPASAFPAVDPAAPFLGMDLAVAAAFSGPPQALVGRMPAAAAASLATPAAAPRSGWAQSLAPRPADRSAVRDLPRPLRRRARPATLQAPPTRRPRRRRAHPSRPTPRTGGAWISAPGRRRRPTVLGGGGIIPSIAWPHVWMPVSKRWSG